MPAKKSKSNGSFSETDILKIIKEFSLKLPKFKDGRINYSKSKIAPVVTAFVKYQSEILLLKRSNKVSTYRGKWNTVAGYLDEVGPVKDKVLEELSQEIGVMENQIKSIKLGKTFNFTDKSINRTWISTPVLVCLKKKPVVKLNEEHTEFRWIKPEDIKKFDIVTKLEKSWERVND
jgi:isopentenyldiphosphate isomerase